MWFNVVDSFHLSNSKLLCCIRSFMRMFCHVDKCIELRPWSTKSLVRMEMPFPQVTPHGDQTDHAVAAHSGTSSSSVAEEALY